MTRNMKRVQSVVITICICFLLCFALSKCNGELPYIRTDDGVKDLQLAIGRFNVKAEYASGSSQIRLYMVQQDATADTWFADSMNIKSYSSKGLQALVDYRQVRASRGSLVLDVFIFPNTTSIVLLHNGRPMLLVEVVR